MKNFFLFLSVTLMVNVIVQAQPACPTQIVDGGSGGSYVLTLLNSMRCADFSDGMGGYLDISINSKLTNAVDNFGIPDCSTVAGITRVDATNQDQMPVPFINDAAHIPYTLKFGTMTCQYNGDGNLIVLPVELMTFTAHPLEKRNALHWTTASEVNNKGFQVERQNPTTDKWDIIGFVKAQGKAASYDFTDGNPLLLASSNTSYYRLRQIDNDGKETLSKVVSATTKGKQTLKVYPTLVSNGILTVDTDGTSRDNREGGDYAIYNVFGQQVQNGKTTQRLDVSALAKGTYILKVGAEQVKFVKQ